jgi:hypothetical protein
VLSSPTLAQAYGLDLLRDPGAVRA